MNMRSDFSPRFGGNPSLWANVVLCLIIVLLIGFGIGCIADAPDIVQLLAPEPDISERVDTLGDRLTLVDYSFDLHRGGNRVQAFFTLANESDNPVRDIRISCDMYDRSGEPQGRAQWVIYEMLGGRNEHRFMIDQQRFISPLVSAEAIICRLADVEVLDMSAVGEDAVGH